MFLRFISAVSFSIFLAIFAGSIGAETAFDKPPIWERGQTWHYVAYLPTNPGVKFYDLTWTAVNGHTIASSETEGGHVQLQYYNSDKAWTGIDGLTTSPLDGTRSYEPVTRFSPPIPLYSFPLTVGKTWSDCSENTVLPGGEHCASFKVVGTELLHTRIGQLTTVLIDYRRIDFFGQKHEDGKLFAKRWYAPAIGNVVRIERYHPKQNGRHFLTTVIDGTSFVSLPPDFPATAQR